MEKLEPSYIHGERAGLVKSLFYEMFEHLGGKYLPMEYAVKWWWQAHTAYDDLPESGRDSNRHEYLTDNRFVLITQTILPMVVEFRVDFSGQPVTVKARGYDVPC